jgi:hypothetical protein
MQSEHSFSCAVADAHVDLFVGGFVFRVQLVYEKEVHLLRAEDSPLAATLERALVHRPAHAVAMKGFQFRHQLFGPTVRYACAREPDGVAAGGLIQ